MNLLDEPWIPVLRRDGEREWVAPAQLARADLVAFAADRADFNGALAQFAIGLLQTTTPVQTSAEWRALFAQAPSAEALAQWFAPYAAAFEFDGEGPRFMQDQALATSGGKVHDIAGLLMDTPSENAVPQNKDLWVKRDARQSLCWRCTAAALLHMQLVSPAGGGGGGGKFVGVRGGGPLTSLLIAHPRRSLWHDLWLNVIERSDFDVLPGELSGDRLDAVFPWLSKLPLAVGEPRRMTPSEHAPAMVFWMTPRRIRIDFDSPSAGSCDICRRDDQSVVRTYRDCTGGMQFKDQSLWDHPLSPYRFVDKGGESGETGWNAVRQRRPLAYRDWFGIAICRNRAGLRRAKVIDHCMTRRFRDLRGQLRIWAFGYDLRQGKTVAWHEATVPLLGVPADETSQQQRIEAEVDRWVEAARISSDYLVEAVRDARFPMRPKEETWRKLVEKADLTAVDAAFWSATEPRFYAQLRELIDCTAAERAFDDAAVNEAWLAHLRQAALQLFDEQFVGAGPVAQQQPARTAVAYRQLRANLFGPKLRETLGLRVEWPAGAADKPKTRQRRKGAS